MDLLLLAHKLMIVMKLNFLILLLFLSFGMSIDAKHAVSPCSEANLSDTIITQQNKNDKHIVSLKLRHGVEYTGEVRMMRPHGTGKAKYRNGDSYIGEFFRGKRSGKGEMHYAGGDKYIGGFLKDSLHGDGKLYLSPPA